MSRYDGPHPKCWTGEDFLHVCQEPSGRLCMECNEPAGTSWGTFFCPRHDVERIARITRNLEALAGEEMA